MLSRAHGLIFVYFSISFFYAHACAHTQLQYNFIRLYRKALKTIALSKIRHLLCLYPSALSRNRGGNYDFLEV